MLESLDVLIAFAVIMTVVSLLISVVVQMLSAASNLRGKNLANGLVETFLTVGGNEADEALKIGEMAAQRLAGYLLTRTGLSDHALGGGGSSSSAIDRKKFAGASNPIGGVNWALAGAVRPDEIFAALRQLARLPPSDSGDALNKEARKLLAALGVPQTALDDVAAKKAEADKFLVHLKAAMIAAADGLDESGKAQLAATAQSLEAKANEAVAAAQRAVTDTAKAIDAAYERFRFWFESGQDRAQQWFTTQTRWVTLSLALAAAFVFQLDTIEIYRDLVRNPAKAKAIAAQASALTEQGERILTEGKNLFSEARGRWIAMQVDGQAKLEPIHGAVFIATDTRSSAREKVMQTLGGKVPAGIKGTFDDALDQAVEKELQLNAGEYQSLRTALDESGFELMKEGDGWRWGDSYCDGLKEHLFGMLFSAALLTLGAPFWFNTLKSLTNLRSALAKNIDAERGEKDQGTPKRELPPP